MGRVFTLRGMVQAYDNVYNGDNLLFDYVSPDRTRAWKITDAHIWPVDWNDGSLGTDGFMILNASLATDSGVLRDNIVDPSENRTCAWGQQTYNTREAAGTIDFICPNSTSLGRMDFLIDPETLVTKELYLNVWAQSEVDVTFHRRWGFMVTIEEQTITPSQSIFQQIKGMGQDI